MPTRLIREGILTSTKINEISERAELFFRKILSVADDHGRYFAHPTILRANCYPMRLDTVTETHVKQMLGECVAAGLVVLYNNAEHIWIPNFKQQTRSKSKFPEPSENELLNNCKSNVHGMLSKCSRDAKQMFTLVEGEGEGEGEGDTVAPLPLPTLSEVFDEWNKHQNLPKCLLLSDKRRIMLKTRLGEPFFKANWLAAMDKISVTPFCLGQNDRSWKATFEWFISADAVPKIIEGKYDGEPRRVNGVHHEADSVKLFKTIVNSLSTTAP